MRAAAPLAGLEVLVIDCQATAAAPRGELLELGWAASTGGRAGSRLVRLPAGVTVPAAVSRLTGLTARGVAGAGTAAEALAQLLADAAPLGLPVPAVAHFARFERPFVERHGGAGALELVCTHEIARRLLPGLPRRTLRALTGYFGRAVSPLRRSAEHVEATAFVWRSLLPLLQERGVETWGALREWLAQPARRARTRFEWPMPRAHRLAAPDAPGLYRMHRADGGVLYVGRAASLKTRVNSYFAKQRGAHERTLELLSQARSLSFQLTESPLEAALLEPDEIKRHRPPYNVALAAGRSVWFAALDLGARAAQASDACPTGPFGSGELLDGLEALSRRDPAALGRWGPGRALFDEGLQRLERAHPELEDGRRRPASRLLGLGGRLWREGMRPRLDREERRTNAPGWTAETVQRSLEQLAVRAALALRRARWHTRLCEASLVFEERGFAPRLLLLERGDLALRAAAARELAPPKPPGHRRTARERHEGFDAARLDRLQALTTELKRLVHQGAALRLHVGGPAPLGREALACVLDWV